MTLGDEGPRLRYVALDLDGTTLNDRKFIDKETVELLRALSQEGVVIILASGRMTPSVLIHEKALEIDCHLVTYNGGYCSLQRSLGRPLVFHRPLPTSVSDSLIDWAKQTNTCVNLYIDDVLYGETNEAHVWQQDKYSRLAQVSYVFVPDITAFKGRSSTKVLLLFDKEDEHVVQQGRLTLERHLEAGPRVNLVNAEFFVEVLDNDVQKGHGLAGLMRSINDDMSLVVAFGDGQNDVEFLSTCAVFWLFGGHSNHYIVLAWVWQCATPTSGPRRPRRTSRPTATMRMSSRGSC